MNKNRFLRLASGLFVLCLITTSAISGTFAKYATGDSGNDTARVAKWGVELSTSGTLFGTDYEKKEALENADSIMVGTSESVSASEKVVAPGTKNDVGFQVALKGAPEVAYKVTSSTVANTNKDIYLKAGSYGIMLPAYGVNADTSFEKLYIKDTSGNYVKAVAYDEDVTEYFKLQDECDVAADYYPIAWTLTATDAGNKFGLTTTQYTKTSEMANAIVTALNEKTFVANAAVNVTYTLTWEWAFEVNDGADTILGNLGVTGLEVVKTTDAGANYVEVDTADYSLNVGFDIAVEVVQVN